MTEHDPTVPSTTAEFMAQACALEAEAAERYEELAQLMRAHHNEDVAELFGKMARIEGLHRQQILDRMGQTPAPDPAAYRWETPEGPETTDHGDLHYLMTPWHALKLAEHNERRAVEFFQQLADRTDLPAELRAAAAAMAVEEREHVGLIQAWLDKIAAPESDWDHDCDPPNAVD